MCHNRPFVELTYSQGWNNALYQFGRGRVAARLQDYAGHKNPRTTRRYDHSRDSLDRNAACTVAAYLA